VFKKAHALTFYSGGLQPSLNEARTSPVSARTFLANVTKTKQHPALLCHRMYILPRLSVSSCSRWRSKSAGWGNSDKIAVVGLPDTAVKESKNRDTSAISNSWLRCRMGKGSASTWLRRMSARKDLALTCQLPLDAESGRKQPVVALDAFCISGEQTRLDFGEVKGQQHLKRAIGVAADAVSEDPI
jgi:hypothetical protein